MSAEPRPSMAASRIRGRLVLADRVVAGEIAVEDGLIARIETVDEEPRAEPGPIIAPGYIDVHVHGWGGHSAMGGLDALDGMARSLLRRGVTSFLPTAVSAPLDVLAGFADAVRGWSAVAPANGSGPLGFNLEGPFLAGSRKGAHDAAHLRAPADVPADRLEPLLGGLRVVTIAPELPGAIDLIGRLAARGVQVSLGHSDATLTQAQAGYAAGATSTTHLFNAMSGVHHRDPGLAVAALVDDAIWVELIADGHHVDASLVPLVIRTKPADRLLLVSDAIPAGGTAARRAVLGALECEIDAGRVTLAGTTTLAGSVIALDDAVRFLAGVGMPLPAVVAAASTNPAALLGATDRGRLAAGLRADLVELDDDLRVRRVMRGGEWYPTA
jgi:N-acetylglucosamine-6-phosphate deacetylase